MIPQIDLAAQHRAIRAELGAAVAEVLDSARFVLGESVSAFEKEFADYVGAAHAVGVGSGTGALHLALLAAGVGPGDEVVTVPFTFVATVAAVRAVGARPVLVDVDPVTLTLDPARLPAAISPRTRAVIPVHLYGHPADMDPILAVARPRGLAVIEDAAQAHGAVYRGRPVGSLGDLACWSFYPSKNLGACGEAGLVVTGSPEHRDTLRALRDHGQDAKHHHRLVGFNERLDALQAAVLRVKLRYLEVWTEWRRAHAARYDRRLAGVVETPRGMDGVRHVYHQYVIRSDRRDELAAHLARHGISTAIHYPTPVHLQPAYRDLGYRPGDFPVSEAAAASVLSLPMYAELADEDVDQVAEAVRAFAGGGAR